MSDVPQYPAGWYPDPQNPTIVRWWDGSRWTEAWHPAPQAPAYQAPAAPTPETPAAPAAPDSAPPAPAASDSAPPASAPPAAPAPTPPASAAAHAYPAPPVADHDVRRDIPTHTASQTNTVWIWLVVFLPLLSLATYFLLDWRGYIDDVVSASMQPTVDSQAWMLSWTAGSLGITLFGYVVVGAQILFAFLDWRALRARGIEKPFHWAWIFLAIIVTNGVYVIGRGVVLRRRTGTGLAPVWAWIAVTALGFIVGIVFASVLINDVFALLMREGLLTP